MTAEADLADRFRGALVGTAVDDALGAPEERRPSSPANTSIPIRTPGKLDMLGASDQMGCMRRTA